MRGYRHIFGPVLSRRLGLSLGVDLVEHKTCSLNCIYCECGRTTDLTVERREYVPASEIIDELSLFLRDAPDLDYITYSGSGEPTLNTGIGTITKFIKENYPQYKVALLTNGTLFTDSNLIGEVKDVDLIIPSLDAVSKDVFLRINRPQKSLDIKRIIDGLISLRASFGGLIYLEIFIIPGVNDGEDEINRLVEVVKMIRPDKVQLNSLDRPPAEEGVKKADYGFLKKIASKFEPAAEIIGRYDEEKTGIQNLEIREVILETIKRRPVTREELKIITGLRMKEVDEVIDLLLKSGEIIIVDGPRGKYLKRVK